MNDDEKAKLSAIYHELTKVSAFLLGQYSATKDKDVFNACQSTAEIVKELDELRR